MRDQLEKRPGGSNCVAFGLKGEDKLVIKLGTNKFNIEIMVFRLSIF